MAGTRTTRRAFLRDAVRTAAIGATGLAAACSAKATPTAGTEATAVPQATPKVIEKVITATPAPKEVVRIKLWEYQAPEIQPGYQKMVEAFNQKYAGNIECQIQQTPAQSWPEKLMSMIAANDGPDCFETRPQPDDFPKRGFVERLTPYIQRDGLKPEELWWEIAWKTDMWQGSQWHVARSVHPAGWSYNKTLLDEAGVPYPKDDWTVDEFLQACIKVRNKAKGIWGCTISGHEGIYWGSLALPYSMGFELISKDGRKVQGPLDSQHSIDVIQWYLDLQVKYDVAASASAAEAMGGWTLGSGKVAFAEAQPEYLRSAEGSEVRWGLVRSPCLQGYKQHGWNSASPYWMWSGAKNKNEIWELMKWISGPEGSKIFMEITKWGSPCVAIWKEMGADQPETAEKDPLLAREYKDLLELPGQKPYYCRSEYFWKCVDPPFSGIWQEYIEGNKRPLAPLVVKAAAEAQQCLDNAYASE